MVYQKMLECYLPHGIDMYNFTKLPIEYENQHLYIVILSLYQKIYLDVIEARLNSKIKKKAIEGTKDFIAFTKKVAIKGITNDSNGSELYKKYQQALEIDLTYRNIKSKYDVIMKDVAINKNSKMNKALWTAIALILLLSAFNLIWLICK